MDHKVFLPWPVIMTIADKLDEQGLTSLAREARGKVWNEASRLFCLDNIEKEPAFEEWCPHVHDVEIVYELTVAEPGINRKMHSCKECVGEHMFLLSRFGLLTVDRENTIPKFS